MSEVVAFEDLAKCLQLVVTLDAQVHHRQV